jgi:acetyl esterase/lipase
MNKFPPQRRTLSKFELARLVLTLSAVTYLFFFIGRALLLSPDLLGGLKEFLNLGAAETELKIVRNLSYVAPADPHRSGDLYLPKATGQRRPAAILIHGGTWKDGSRDDEKENARYLAKHGYVAFTIDYRLVGQGGEFPHDIADVKDALAFLAEHAAEYAIDPNKIVLSGSSSGGHMAMLAAYSPNSGDLHAESHPTSSVRAAAAVSLFGLSDLSGDYAHASDKAHVVHYLNGKTPHDSPSLYVTASPINYGRSAVPTIFAHGTDDHNVPISQSTTMASILRKNSIRAEIVPVEGAGHWFGPVTRELVLSRVVVFLNQALSGTRTEK